MIGEPKKRKIEATLNCIKDSETILNGEYYVVHSDFIIALEEEIEKLYEPNIIVKIGDAKEVKEQIEQLQQELQRKDNIINEVKDIINRMIYMGYCAKTGKGTTATNFMAVGEQSEFGTRAKYILDKIKELEGDK